MDIFGSPKPLHFTLTIKDDGLQWDKDPGNLRLFGVFQFRRNSGMWLDHGARPCGRWCFRQGLKFLENGSRLNKQKWSVRHGWRKFPWYSHGTLKNKKEPLCNGCFNRMIPNLYIGNDKCLFHKTSICKLVVWGSRIEYPLKLSM